MEGRLCILLHGENIADRKLQGWRQWLKCSNFSMQDFPTTSSSWSMAVLWQWSNHRLDSSVLVLSYFIHIYVEKYLLFAVSICYRSFVFDEVSFFHLIKALWVGLSCLTLVMHCYFKHYRFPVWPVIKLPEGYEACTSCVPHADVSYCCGMHYPGAHTLLHLCIKWL